MNAIPQKPFEADPAAAKGGKPAAEAENVRITIDFEDESKPQPQPGHPHGSPRLGADMGPGSTTGRPFGPAEADRAEAAPGEAAREADAPPPAASAARRKASAPPTGPGADQGEAHAAAPNAGSPLAVPPHLAGIEVTLSVEIGSHRLPLKDLLSVDPGQLFALDRMTSDPVSILVNGKPFAQGEIVAIGDRFGVRLLDIVQPEAS